MKLTKKDFALLASVINNSFKHNTDFVGDIANMLAMSNPRFNREKWIDAVFDGVVESSAATRSTPSHTDDRGWERFKVGEMVRVMREPTEAEIKASAWKNCWIYDMNESIGATLYVMSVNEAGVWLNGGFGYPWWVLEHV